MYKAIFSDIDGTLVNSNKLVSDETKLAIQKAKENGIEFIICSGRYYVSAKRFYQECNSSRYMICTNGAEIYDCQTNEVLYSSNMEYETCLNLYELALQNDLVIKFDCKYGRFVSNSNNLLHPEIKLTEEITKFLSENNITQVSFGAKSEEDLQKIKEKIELIKDIKVSNEFIWLANGTKYYTVNCNNKNVSKANAMMGLCKFLKIDINDVIAIGDGVNDIEMIKTAGLGIAMENARNIRVKEAADHITISNEESGVAKVIEKILE